jgi:ATP phosphoribosyltransferase
MGEILRIAVQKSGRLSEDSLKLIKESGINFSKSGGTLKSNAYNFPIEFLYLRDDDIPGYVEDGIADIGIIGENVLVEYAKNVDLILRLGFSKCRLSIGVPKNVDYQGIQDLQGKEIATSYPNLLGSYLKENNVEANIHVITGSVEIAPSIGLADAVCDIVSSGSTLISNGLKEAEGIFASEAVLIANREMNDNKKRILDRLLFRMKGVMAAKNTKYITLNAPESAVDAICDLLPGVSSPSINSLRKEGWKSIASVVNENDFWQIVDQVRELGAEGLLVLPIEKIIE